MRAGDRRQATGSRVTPCELYRLGLEELPAAGDLRVGSAGGELLLAAPLLVGGLLVVGSLALSKRKAGFGR